MKLPSESYANQPKNANMYASHVAAPDQGAYVSKGVAQKEGVGSNSAYVTVVVCGPRCVGGRSFRVRFTAGMQWVDQTLRASSSMVLMCFLMNSKEEKKMALTTQERLIETPRPRYMWPLKNSIFGAGTISPFEWRSALRW